MNHHSRLHGVLIRVTFKTESRNACGFQVYARGLTRIADHVARQTAHLDRWMYVLALAFIFVTLETLWSVGSFFEGDWVHACKCAGAKAREEQDGDSYRSDSVGDHNRVLQYALIPHWLS
jgi:hypothetical protein